MPTDFFGNKKINRYKDNLKSATIKPITFHQLGDSALLLNFPQRVDLEVNKEVYRVKLYLESKKIQGLLYFIPAFCSLAIGYDSDLWNFSDLVERIRRYLDKYVSRGMVQQERRLKIPVCYIDKFGLDLPELSRSLGLATEDIIRLHTERTYRVYMLGFLPGFVYLGDLLPALNCRRREKPRLKVPAQSIGLAGQQTGIYPLNAPGGWQIIGRTPISIFRPDLKDPFLFKMGDTVTFYSVGEEEFNALAQRDREALDQTLFY